MAMANEKNGWFVHAKKVNRPALRLFCLHYAGGSASFCSGWARRLPATVEVVSIQLPGREQRYLEPLITDMAALIDALIPALEGRLMVPFAVFGHSMGAAIGYELISELQRRRMEQPVIFFASGRQAPQFAEKDAPVHRLPDEEFCSAFLQKHYSKDLQSVFADEEAKEFFLPQLKADVQLVENYRYDVARAVKLACPVIALDCCGGKGHVEEHELAAWREHTSGAFRSYRFPGDHFFIESAQAQVLAVISNELLPFLR